MTIYDGTTRYYRSLDQFHLSQYLGLNCSYHKLIVISCCFDIISRTRPFLIKEELAWSDTSIDQAKKKVNNVDHIRSTQDGQQHNFFKNLFRV